MPKKINQAVILAGGLGTRLQPFTNDNPKPMFPINEKPYLTYLLKQVKSFGIEKVVLLLGYRAEKIMDYFGTGVDEGLSITYRVTPVEFDTGARIREAYPVLEDTFLLMYCDNYCPINWDKKVCQFESENSLIQITAYSNKDGYTKNNLRCLGDGRVAVYDKKRLEKGLNGVDIGYAIVKKAVLSYLPEGNVNFEKEIYPLLVEKQAMTAYVTNHRYYSIGSYERIELTKQFFSERKAVFLDRDGTLNVRPPKACYVEKKKDFVWLPNAKEAVKMLKDAGYLVFLFTNQPGIARGMVSKESLDEIHEKMLSDLKEIGANIDKIYMCPHGWDDGCDCRKPKPGMLYQAQKEYSLNLTECIVIGDDERDIQAGEAADCTCYQVTEQRSLMDIVKYICGK